MASSALKDRGQRSTRWSRFEVNHMCCDHKRQHSQQNIKTPHTKPMRQFSSNEWADWCKLQWMMTNDEWGVVCVRGSTQMDNEYSIIYLLERTLCNECVCVLLLSHFQVYLRSWRTVSTERPNTKYGFRNRNQKLLSTRCRDSDDDDDERGESLIKFLIIQICSFKSVFIHACIAAIHLLFYYYYFWFRSSLSSSSSMFTMLFHSLESTQSTQFSVHHRHTHSCLCPTGSTLDSKRKF